MTQDEVWLKKYQEVMEFMETNHRNPSKFDPLNIHNTVIGSNITENTERRKNERE